MSSASGSLKVKEQRFEGLNKSNKSTQQLDGLNKPIDRMRDTAFDKSLKKLTRLSDRTQRMDKGIGATS
jgi:hypothetical protein